jgi:hypothetical protein
MTLESHVFRKRQLEAEDHIVNASLRDYMASRTNALRTEQLTETPAPLKVSGEREMREEIRANREAGRLVLYTLFLV